ncbi:MAG: hypothetical protein ACRDJ9_15010 [Dehalococcoidia bacterium]
MVEWVVSAAVLVTGIVLAGIAMLSIGLSLWWSGFGAATNEAAGRPWWLWLLFLAPPVLMLVGGVVARRAGGSTPIALGCAGGIGVLVGVGYLVTAYLSSGS